MTNSKKMLFLAMFIMVIVVCLMPNINSGDGEVPYKEISASTQTENMLHVQNDVERTDFVGLSAKIFSADIIRDIFVDRLIAGMTIEEKVAQLFFIKDDDRFDYTILDEYPVGGIIFFSSDFAGETSESLRNKLASFQNNTKIPLLMGVDEEGGDVIRVSRYKALADYRFLSPRDLYTEGGYDRVYEDAAAKSRLLASYGINVNFGPVCDISLEPSEYMYSRSFGISAEATAEYVSTVLTAMEEENMGSVMKHFPGYGSNGDTHSDIIRDKRAYSTFVENDFVPFIKGIEKGADCILVSHNIVECMDDRLPASLSPKVINILRDDLGFEGVIITDDLMMNGVSDFIDEEESAVAAVLAGNDMILSTDFILQYNSVLKACCDGTISEERIDESLRKIINWKYKLGLFN